MTSVQPFVVTNVAPADFHGWLDGTIPIRNNELTASWRPKGDTRALPAHVGEKIGGGARRCYIRTECIGQGSGAVSQLEGELIFPAQHGPIPPSETPVALVRVGEVGADEVAWTSDLTGSDGPCKWRRVLGRLGNFVHTLICWRFEDEPWTHFEYAMVHSNPMNQDLDAKHGLIVVGHSDAYVHVYGPTLEQRATKLAAGTFGWARNLYAPDVLGNGQGHTAVRGVLLFYLQARKGKEQQDLDSMRALQEGNVRFVAADWEGAAGPFRAVPALSPLLGNGRNAAIERYQNWRDTVEKERIEPWAPTTMGMLPYPGSTGAQEDFPIGPAPEVLSPVVPAPYNLQELEAAGYAEFRRPIHYRNADGTLNRASEQDKWVSWVEGTHYSPVVSPNRLGKPEWWGPWESHGYVGRDAQHYSLNRLGAAVLIGGSRLLQEELHDHIEHFIASTFDNANRARGRHLHGAAWLYLLTGREDLLQAIKREVRKNEQTWPSGGQAWTITPSSWSYPDNRVLGGRTPFWVGWSESLCSPGLFLASRLDEGGPALELVRRSCRTLIRYGWFKRPGTSGYPGWTIAGGITYLGFTYDQQQNLWVPNGQEGRELDSAAYQDKNQVEDSGGGFERWAYASCWIARQICQEPDVQEKADELMAQIRATRGPTQTFDDIDRWLAVA